MEYLTNIFSFLLLLSLVFVLHLLPYLKTEFPGNPDLFFHLNKIIDLSYPQMAEGKAMQNYPFFMHYFYQKITKKFHLFTEVQTIRLHLLWNVLNCLISYIFVSLLINPLIGLI